MELLSLAVKPRRMTGSEWRENLFLVFVEATPEIQEYVLRKAREYQAQHRGSMPAGQPGVCSMSEEVAPAAQGIT